MSMEEKDQAISESLQDVRRNFCGDKEIALSRLGADVTHRFSRDSRTHQRTEKIPMAQAVVFIEGCPQTAKGRIVAKHRIHVHIIGNINQHLPLCSLITAKGVQAFRFTEQIPAHFQFSRGEKAGGCAYISPHTGVYFVPELGKQEPVFRCSGNFLDVASVHDFTSWGYYTTPLPKGKMERYTTSSAI